MTVSYGGDRFKTFPATTDGAPVVETSINLAFKELELITRERVGEGFLCILIHFQLYSTTLWVI